MAPPFVWILVHAQLDHPGIEHHLHQAQPPLALICEDTQEPHPLMRPRAKATVLRPGTTTPFFGDLANEAIEPLFGIDRPLHYTYGRAQSIAREFALSELAETMPTLPDLAWMAGLEHTMSIWTRNGIAWRDNRVHAHGAHAHRTMGDLLNGNAPVGTLADLAATLGMAAFERANVGLAAIDVPVDASSHTRLKTCAHTIEDLTMVQRWMHQAHGEVVHDHFVVA